MRHLFDQKPFKMHYSFSRILSILLVMTLGITSLLLLAACGGAAATTAATTKAAATTTTASGTTAAMTTAKTFTVAELAAFDGKNGNKAYIAVDGIVYDVTTLAEWGAKMHAGKFVAGKDYSAEIKNAPHPVGNLLKAVKIGVLKG